MPRFVLRIHSRWPDPGVHYFDRIYGRVRLVSFACGHVDWALDTIVPACGFVFQVCQHPTECFDVLETAKVLA